MKLYNSLTKRVEYFTPLKNSEISIYSCGPTLYGRPHIGNLASFIYADLLKNTLALNFPESKIKHVMNLTDVDDKTIGCSQEKYPSLEPMAALQKLTQHYENLFMKDLQAVGVDTTKIDFVWATDYIPQMQELITELVASGIGYVTNHGVYFSIAKYKQAGKKYGQLVEITSESTGAARVNNDEYDKDDVHDFALWKKQKPGEPAWDFQLDGQDLTGRPGWHIECSAMATTKLGLPFDIHTGGVDLIFPHHENEIAQSTADKADSTYAKFFIHNQHILVDDQKMSKSLNNFYTLQDLVEKGFDPLGFRLLVLQAHYRSQAHFSFDNLEAAENRLNRFHRWADRQFQPQTYNGSLQEPIANAVLRQLTLNQKQIANDLDTPNLFSQIEAVIERTQEQPLTKAHLSDFKTLLILIDEITGLGLSQRNDISNEQKQLIGEREAARQNKDWAKSDKLRNNLVEQGIGLNDTPSGAIWYHL